MDSILLQRLRERFTAAGKAFLAISVAARAWIRKRAAEKSTALGASMVGNAVYDIYCTPGHFVTPQNAVAIMFGIAVIVTGDGHILEWLPGKKSARGDEQ